MNQKKLLVSVLIPCYNAQSSLDKAIDSIVNQSYSNLEIMICDDCSTDETYDLITKRSKFDNRIKVHRNSQNKGYLYTINYLMEKCTGELITTQDADDWSEVNRIECQIEKFYDDTVGACITGFKVIDEKENLIEDVPNIEKLKEDALSNYFNSRFNINSILFSREVYNQIGGYNDYFNKVGAEDYYWFYLISEKFKVSCVNRSLYNYIIHSNSFTANAKSFKQLVINDLLKFMLKQREKFGKDALTDDKLMEDLVSYENKLNRNYNSKYLLTLVALFKQLKGRNYSQGFRLIAKNPKILISFNSLFKAIKLLYRRKSA
ncbi:glycosyltransferase family 2 protein [Aquimarina sp. U1-2]|uniref:glycosyltransferase family 2 protein n=1 Tax=Aquimarina sp. U1-2 TaxID=2823141 RepID=UPI001AEC8366|nr:glycosyltransferase family A protein [Aquimarina sp. U1-2]MBP2833881.1 glycosyltransferase family 2 protein [Aquimarina sp. U1-2]